MDICDKERLSAVEGRVSSLETGSAQGTLRPDVIIGKEHWNASIGERMDEWTEVIQRLDIKFCEWCGTMDKRISRLEHACHSLLHKDAQEEPKEHHGNMIRASRDNIRKSGGRNTQLMDEIDAIRRARYEEVDDLEEWDEDQMEKRMKEEADIEPNGDEIEGG